MPADLDIAPATADEAQSLADLRVAAMRPSLEAVGRFDPDRARRRFLSTFVAADTFVLRADGDVVGFYVVRRHPEHVYLNHLYIRDAHQGRGFGKWVLDRLQADAQSDDLPIRVTALKDSPANRFYASSGFVFERAEEFDNHYIWQSPDPAPA